MTEQIVFLKKLDRLGELGRAQGGKLSREAVGKYFDNRELTKEQEDLICEYLVTRQVIVPGYEPKTEKKTEMLRSLEPGEETFLLHYKEDLQSLRSYTESEKEDLIRKVKAGEDRGKELSEAMLEEAFHISEGHFGGKVQAGDLVQEANLALLLAVSELPETDENGRDFIRKRIRLGIDAVLTEETDVKLKGKKIAEKLNALTEAITTLTQDMDCEVTVEDLAEFLNLSEGEIEDLLRIAGEV